MTENSSQLDTISRLLQLERSFRHAETVQELAYILVNDSRNLLNYRQAVFWRNDNASIFAVSSLAIIDNNAPYIIWLNKVCQQLNLQYKTDVQVINAESIASDEALEWPQWLPENALWLPFSNYSEEAQTGLLLAREDAWNDSELYLLQHLADSFEHAWIALAPTPSLWHSFRFVKKNKLFFLAVFFSTLAIPVKQTVLAPANVIATNPTIVRAAIDGVVNDFFIQPNDPVQQDQILLNLDDTAIKNKLYISQKALAVVEAEYRKTAQQAMFDQQSKSQLTLLKGRIEQQQAEIKNIEDWLTRIEIKAPHQGIAIFSDTNEWLGRPVKLGERILMIAKPNEVELEIQLPIADAINLHPGAEVLLYLNIAPTQPISAKLYYSAYQAKLAANNSLAFRLKARLDATENVPRIGLKGTAKVYGEKVSFVYYLLRRPLATLRQWLGM